MNNEQQTRNRGILQPAPATPARLGGIALVLALVITGCTSIRLDPVITDTVAVELMDSPGARVATVQVRDHDGRLKVSGRLKKRHAGRSPIPGHLHIEALAQDGTLLGQVTTRYRRLSAKTGTSEFSQVLAVGPEKVRTVRVIHHQRDDDEAANGNLRPGASRKTYGPIQPV